MRLGRRPALTPEQAEEAREMYRGKERTAKWKVFQIARYFRVDTSTIQAVLNRKGAYK